MLPWKPTTSSIEGSTDVQAFDCRLDPRRGGSKQRVQFPFCLSPWAGSQGADAGVAISSLFLVLVEVAGVFVLATASAAAGRIARETLPSVSLLQASSAGRILHTTPANVVLAQSYSAML